MRGGERDRRAFLGGLAAAVALAPGRLTARAAARGWRAGVASVDITPRSSLWMAGFAARPEPSRGVALPLHAKALALEDARGARVVLVTLDLLGITAGVAARIAERARRTHGLGREQ